MNGLKNGLFNGRENGLNNGLFEGLNNGLNNGLFNNEYSFDLDALNFINAANIVNPIQQNAIKKLVYDLKVANIWTKMKAVYPFVGGTATTHKFNLKNPVDSNAAFRLVFNGGWVHSSTGALPNGTNTWADTFLIPSTTLNLNNQHISFYSRTNTNGTEVEIGCNNSGVAPNTLLELRTSGTTYLSLAGNAYTSYIDANSFGLYLGSRTATSTIKLFKNNANVASGTTASTSNPIFSIGIGALNSGTLRQYYTTKQCAFVSIGDGLTDAEALSFYTAVQTYNTTLGRQV